MLQRQMSQAQHIRKNFLDIPQLKFDYTVKYFDETLGLDENIRNMLNERIREVE